MMNKLKATRMFEKALKAVPNPAYGHPEDMAKQWRDLDAKEFLLQYCLTVFGSNFKWAVVEKYRESLSEAFKHFDLEAVARMKPVKLEKLPIKNQKKADRFLKGAKMVHREGWGKFKKRLEREGMDMLEELDGIGPVLKKELAKQIGLEDTAKDDVHLQRCAEHCGASSVDEMVGFLAAKFKRQRRQVDAILWEWCAKHRPWSAKHPPTPPEEPEAPSGELAAKVAALETRIAALEASMTALRTTLGPF